MCLCDIVILLGLCVKNLRHKEDVELQGTILEVVEEEERNGNRSTSGGVGDGGWRALGKREPELKTINTAHRCLLYKLYACLVRRLFYLRLRSRKLRIIALWAADLV